MGLFPEQRVNIPLSRTSGEVIQELDAAMDNTLLRGLFRDRLMGHASVDRIRIRYFDASWQNEFSPCFVGRVNTRQKCIEGLFCLSRTARAFLLVWLAVFGLLFLPIVLTRIAHQGWTAEDLKQLAFTGVMLLVGGWVLPRLGWYVSRSDIARIETALQQAANGDD